MNTGHRTGMAPAFLILFFICVGKLFAADSVTDFSAANELYAKGKFAEAAAIYEKIRQADGQSASLLFNCGNAEFKAGHLGKAIAAYREAELLTPRDPELRANLAFVRTQVSGGAQNESHWKKWISAFTLNETAVVAAVFFWLLFGLLAARQIQPALAPKLRGVTRLAVILLVFSGAILAVHAANHFSSPVAVVTESEAAARSGPFDDAQTAFTTHDGAELHVLGRHDDWVQVTDDTGKVGWLSKKQAEVLPGA